MQTAFVERRRFPQIRKLVDSPVFGALVVILILASVLLIFIEYMIGLSPEALLAVEFLNEFITFFFVIELTLRWLVSASTRSFLGSFWIDVIAVIPMLRIFRVGRVFRIARLLRIFSMGTILQRRMSNLGAIFETRILEYGILIGFIIFAVIFGAEGLAQFEVGVDEKLQSSSDAFWKALFSLLAGEYADYPKSFGGKIIFTLLLLFGMGAFAMLTGAFSALMIDKLKESAMSKHPNPEEMTDHIVICGFSSKVAILVTEFLSEKGFSGTEILLVSEHADIDELKNRGVRTDCISVLKEDFTKVETLKKASVNRARIAIILSEAGHNRSTEDIDARTILAALTIERLNPGIHTSAELYNEEYSAHLKMGGVEDVVVQGDISGRLLARVAMHQGFLGFFKDLLTNQEGNALAFQPINPELVGMPVEKALHDLHSRHGILLVGVRPKGAELIVNPRSRILLADDELLVIGPVAPS